MNDYDLLNELSDGEDEFDVDLMACGCRLAAPAKLNLEIEDILRLHNLTDTKKMINLIGALIDAGQIESNVVFELAEKVSRGELQEGKKDEQDKVP